MKLANRKRKDYRHALFLNRMRFAHLRTRTPIKTETQNPGAFAIVHFLIPRATLGIILTHHSGLPVQIQISGHADGHPEHQPRLVLFVALNGSAAV